MLQIHSLGATALGESLSPQQLVNVTNIMDKSNRMTRDFILYIEYFT
jgi:hypothetical protein